MTDEPNEEYEDVYPLLGAIGPYLSFSTGHMNPVEDEYEDEGTLPESTPDDDDDSSDDDDFWEDDEQ